MRLKKHFGAVIFAAVLSSTVMLLSGCTGGGEELSEEEMEMNALRGWFEQDIKSGDKFTDLNDYRYYARAIGLDMDGLLSPDMWEIYYSDSINLNKDIDGKATYLIRLNPDKLLEVWAANNDMTAEDVCNMLGTSRNDLYYNFGYTSNSIDYIKGHKESKVTYPETENMIFGEHNGENRQTVFGTHFLSVSTGAKHRVTYNSTDEAMDIKQRDLLSSTTKSKTYSYTDYTACELAGTFSVNDVKIRRLLLLHIPSGRTDNEGDTPTVMFNMSPFTYGCTDEDRISLYAEETIEESVTEKAPMELSDETEAREGE